MASTQTWGLNSMSTDEKLLNVLDELLAAVKALTKEVQGVGVTSQNVAPLAKVTVGQ